MRRTLMGLPLYEPRVARGVQKPRTWTPNYSARYLWRVGNRYLQMDWYKRLGFCVVELFALVDGLPGRRVTFPEVRGRVVKKPVQPAPASMPDVMPLYETKTLKRFPLVTRFLTDRWYEDGTPRMPGSMWLDSDASAFTILLKEKSTFMCARLRAATLDDVLAAAEVFLGLESPPWEVDNFALERSQTKKKK